MTPRPERRRTWRRNGLRVLAILAALAALAALALILGLRSRPVRQAVLARATAAIEASTGMAASAEDFALRLSPGTITLTGVSVRASAETARPFLTVPRATARFEWRSLWSDRIVLQEVVGEGPRFDLGAPLPDFSGSGDRGEARRTVEIPSIEIAGGTVLSAEMDDSWDALLDRWRLTGVDLSGSYRSDGVAATVSSARVTAESARRPPLTAALTGAFTVGDGGLVVDRLEVDRDALRLRARGRRSAGESALSFEVDAEPAKLFPDLGAAGSVDLSGNLETSGGRLTGDVRADVRALPGELLEPAIAGGAEFLKLAGTRFDVDAELDVDVALAELTAAEVAERLTGHARVSWLRRRETLLAAEVRTLDAGGGPDALRLAAEADVLPAEPGKRRLTGELAATGWRDLADGRVRRGRLELDLADLAGTAARLGVDTAALGLRPFGDLRATITADGPVRAPRLTAAATWRAGGETLATFELRPSGAGLHVAARVLPEDPGRRELAAELRTGAFPAGSRPDLLALLRGAAPGWRSWQLADARVDLDLADAPQTAARLAELWRRLVPGSTIRGPGTWLAGGLALEARAQGPLASPSVELDGSWRPAPGEDLRLAARGVVTAETPFFSGTARWRFDRFELGRLAEDAGLSGRASGTLDFEGSFPDHRATLEVDVRPLRVGSAAVDVLRLTAFSDGTDLELRHLAATLPDGRTIAGTGTVGLGAERRLRSLDLDLELPNPIPSLERVTAGIGLEGDLLMAEIAVEAPGRPLRPVALARAPLVLFGLPETLVRPDTEGTDAAAAGPDREGARRTVEVLLSGLELEPFLPLLDLDEAAALPQATFSGRLTVDVDDPLASTGTIEVSGAALETDLGTIAALDALRFELADRRLVLAPARLLSAGRRGAAIVVAGTFDLEPPAGGEGFVELRRLDVTVDGRFDVAALDPLLAGGRATGEAAVALRVHGPPAAPQVDGKVDGTAASLLFPGPYSTRVESPVAELSASSGETFLEILKARLNGGEIEVTGDLGQASGIDLIAVFEGVRYRLDYGLTVLLRGDLAYRRPPPAGSRALLSGAVLVERGTVRRDVDLDRELLSLLLAPETTRTDEPGISEEVDLDLVIATAEGLRIKNNLADLRADWGRLRVRGTLQNPLVAGRIDVDPGGRITAYGQTVRLDEASIELAGDPAVGPRLDLELTSSLEDPSLGTRRNVLGTSSLGDRGPGNDTFWDSGPDVAGRSQQLTQGILTYYSDRLAGTLSQGLENTQLSLEPLPLFGETDTQARLTATQRLSRFADLIYSVDPRKAEGQTYILHLHDFDFAPRFAAQLFTNDENDEGLTLVQTLELGGERPAPATRLERIAIDAPDEVSERRLRLAFDVRPGDALADGAAFDLELEAQEELRRQGYPGAEVEISVEPLDQRRELRVKVDPGPRVSFAFEGDRPSSAARRRIAQIYRPADDAGSLEEMRREAVNALRQQGYLDPEVAVVSEGDENRTVRVVSRGGRRIAPSRLELAGLEDRTAELLEAQLAARSVRVELAAGVPGADRYLLSSLKALGYPRAEIVGRELSEDGRRLEVRLEPGPRQRLAGLEIAGVPETESARLRGLLPLQPGAPVRSDAVTRSAHALEDDLRRRGFVDARVRTVLEPAAGGGASVGPGPDELPVDLRFEIEAGAFHRLAEVRFEGLRGTRRSWAEHVAELEAGDVYSEQDAGDARRRLMRTGLFERIRFTTETDEGTAGPVSTTVIFDLEEKPRYRVAYGARWESDEGAGVVVEAVDGNFLGRGSTLGTRAIFSGDERSLRLYHALPRVAGTRGGVEIFVEGREEELEGSRVDGVEGWVQNTFPIGRRTRNRVYLRYQDFVVRDAEPGGAQPAGEHFVIPSVGWQLNYDNRERAIGARPSDGLVLGLDLSASDRSFGSDVSTLGLFSQLKLFRSFARDSTPRGLTWAQWWRLGILESAGGSEAVPTVNRLRAGGEYSVRGYRRNSLGPLDDAGNALGGEIFFLVNQELHFPLWGDRLSGVTFFDAGNVWESRDAVDSELFTSLGVGLRATTGLGPLRLDVAFPLDRRPGDDGFKIYVGFGNIF